MLLQGKPTVDNESASQQQFMSELTKQSEALKNAIGVRENSVPDVRIQQKGYF